jgi:hypothetical protein
VLSLMVAIEHSSMGPQVRLSILGIRASKSANPRLVDTRSSLPSRSLGVMGGGHSSFHPLVPHPYIYIFNGDTVTFRGL